MAPAAADVNGDLGISEKLAYHTKKGLPVLGKTALAVLLFSVLRLTPAAQQGGSHPAAAGHQIKALLVDTPLEQHTSVERHSSATSSCPSRWGEMLPSC